MRDNQERHVIASWASAHFANVWQPARKKGVQLPINDSETLNFIL